MAWHTGLLDALSGLLPLSALFGLRWLCEVFEHIHLVLFLLGFSLLLLGDGLLLLHLALLIELLLRFLLHRSEAKIISFGLGRLGLLNSFVGGLSLRLRGGLVDLSSGLEHREFDKFAELLPLIVRLEQLAVELCAEVRLHIVWAKAERFLIAAERQIVQFQTAEIHLIN